MVLRRSSHLASWLSDYFDGAPPAAGGGGDCAPCPPPAPFCPPPGPPPPFWPWPCRRRGARSGVGAASSRPTITREPSARLAKPVVTTRSLVVRPEPITASTS